MNLSTIDILMKCILVLYREHELGESSSNNSRDLVRKVINVTKEQKSKVLLGGEATLLDDIRSFITNMLNNPDHFDKSNILESLSVLLKDKASLLKAIEKNIETEMNPNGLKRSIISIRNILDNYYRDTEIINLFSKASYKLNMGKLDNDQSIQAFAEQVRAELELISFKTDGKDPGLIDEIDFNSKADVSRSLSDVKQQNTDGGKLITGWKKINRMLNGGFRKGEQWVITALQHNYKSGFLQSLFAQLSYLNTPELKDPTKKPLNVLISFEDDISIIMEFLYRYLYFNEFKVVPNIGDLSVDEMSDYVIGKLTRTGYNVKILRVNPSEWTYMHLFNKILEWEAAGFEIHALLLDYLSKMPTTGCITSGPTGTDVRDLFNRVRNFCSQKGILNITPHQVSTEALNLLRSGIKGFEFISELVNKNYYSESKQIPQVVDGEIVLGKSFINKQWGLYVGKGKHRTPVITPDEYKQCMLPFPKEAPILEDIHGDDNSINNTDDFDF